ncbi:MAG: hypothetical protein LC808_19480 [Actinobacteria bacterium]|nr:hypothetical protein [Actinomycetota bacterium]
MPDDGWTADCLGNLVAVGEDFLFSGQVRPSAAAADRRAGPVLASLRAADPAAAHNTKPGDPENEKVLTGRRACPVLALDGLGLSSPLLIVSTGARHRSRPLTRPSGSRCA